MQELEKKLKRLDELKDKLQTWAALEEYQNLHHELEPYQCPICYGFILSGEEGKDFITIRTKISAKETDVNRWHPKCIKKRDIQAQEFKRRTEEQNERMKQIFYEHEHSLRPRIWERMIMVYGLKKDWDAFNSALPKILEEYNLQTDEIKKK